MLSSTTKNCWNGSKGSSPITLPSFSAESMRFLMQRFAMFKRFNLSTFHWASLFVSGGALALNVLTRSFPKFSSVSSSSKLADAILFSFVESRWPDLIVHTRHVSRHVSHARITRNVLIYAAFICECSFHSVANFWKDKAVAYVCIWM